LIAQCGAVSGEVAAAMAGASGNVARQRLGGDHGIAGPTGGHPRSGGPGLHALASETGTDVVEKKFSWRPPARPLVAPQALDMVRRKLM